MQFLALRPYLDEMTKRHASDLFLTEGCAPSLRIDNTIIAMKRPPLDHSDIEVLVEDFLTEEQRDEFESTLEFNLALSLETGERFRINLFRQMHHTGMVVRLIKSIIPTFSDLMIPQIYSDFIMEKRGLVIVSGATGSGKSTSLAAMLDYRNKHGSGHIITVEDPIEYVHKHNKCIFTQREIGIDTYSYGIALKNALRQSPDVVLIGEIRDRETLENAILFCETGHLVVATLHANNSNQSIERIINLFPEEMHHQILMTLSQNLSAILSQRLVRNVSGGRTLAYEIMVNEGLIKVLIEEGKIKELKEIIEKNQDRGMISFDLCLLNLLNAGIISKETALIEADNPNNLLLRINQKMDKKNRDEKINYMLEDDAF